MKASASILAIAAVLCGPASAFENCDHILNAPIKVTTDFGANLWVPVNTATVGCGGSLAVEGQSDAPASTDVPGDDGCGHGGHHGGHHGGGHGGHGGGHGHGGSNGHGNGGHR